MILKLTSLSLSYTNHGTEHKQVKRERWWRISTVGAEQDVSLTVCHRARGEAVFRGSSKRWAARSQPLNHSCTKAIDGM